MSVIKKTVRANEAQKGRMVDKLTRILGGSLTGITVAVLGLAFKSETDDVRESPAATIVNCLLNGGAQVRAHDPKAVDNFKKLFPDVTYVTKSYDAAKGADAVVIVTEWNEYRTLDLRRMLSSIRGNVLLDTRNVLDPEDANEAGFVYEGVGRKVQGLRVKNI